jgi:hypothetical protein
MALYIKPHTFRNGCRHAFYLLMINSPLHKGNASDALYHFPTP